MKHNMTPTDILLALLVVVIWGTNFVVIKIGLEDLPPILFTALRFLLAAVPAVFFMRRPAAPWRLIAAYGLFQFAFQFTLLFSGMKLGLPAGLASLVIQLHAFFTIGLAVLMLGEKPRAAQLIGAFVALSGMALVAAKLEGHATLIGFMLVVAAAVCWAVANIVTKKMGVINALSLVVWGSLLSTPLLLAASWLIEGQAAWELASQRFSLRTLLAVLFNSYPNTLIGFGIWSLLMRRYAAATIAPFALLVPVVGMISAALFLGEALVWWKIVAGLLVIAGLALNQFGTRLWAYARATP